MSDLDKYMKIDPCSCDGIAEAVATAIKPRRRRRKPFTGLDDLSKKFRRNLIRNFFLAVTSTRIELVPENPFRTCLHLYVPGVFSQCELFLHRSMDGGLGGIPFSTIMPGESYREHCDRFIQGEWCVRSNAGTTSYIFVHETISIPKRGQGG